MSGWKRRWFVLPPPGRSDTMELKYYESPSSAAAASKAAGTAAAVALVCTLGILATNAVRVVEAVARESVARIRALGVDSRDEREDEDHSSRAHACI